MSVKVLYRDSLEEACFLVHCTATNDKFNFGSFDLDAKCLVAAGQFEFEGPGGTTTSGVGPVPPAIETVASGTSITGTALAPDSTVCFFFNIGYKLDPGHLALRFNEGAIREL